MDVKELFGHGITTEKILIERDYDLWNYDTAPFY